jgi:7-cyano-7-deazaguanine synthase in queuosine biosynthesis
MPKRKNSDLSQIPLNTKVPFIKKRGYYLERDILRLATVVFNIEKNLKEGLLLPEIIELPLSNETYELIDRDKMKEDIESLIAFVLFKQVNLKIIPIDDTRYRRKVEYPFKESDTICLFSGGVDSLSGLLNARLKFGEGISGVFVAHNDQNWTISIVDKLTKLINQTENISIERIYAPPMGSTGYSQLRGFLYCLCGGIYAKLKNSKRIIISECGPTMYQVYFSPFDTITMTTHPFVLKKAKEITENILQRKIEYVLPFENLTKAEVARIVPTPALLPYTHSCISQRFGKNDGTCYGCITRRLGLLAANIQDAKYERNPLVDKNANADHLLNLLRFSSDVLTDYESLPDYSKENIEEYGKHNLFRRFALDNYLGILKVPQTKRNPVLSRLVSDTLKDIKQAEIEERSEQLNASKIKPDFTRMVK